MFNSDPDHHEHLENRADDVQHLWEEWSEHGVYHCFVLKHFTDLRDGLTDSSCEKLPADYIERASWQRPYH